MPAIFQKGTDQHRSNTLVVGAGLELIQNVDGLPEVSSGGAGEAVVSPSGADDTTAVRNAVNANARTRLAPGTFTVSGIIDVGAGKVVTGSGMDKTIINKTDFAGAVFRFGDTTEYAAIENLRLVGPGKAVGTGNSGIAAVRSGAGLAVARRLRFSNLHIEELSDYAIHLDKCALVDIEQCVLNRLGFNGIFATGASTLPRNSYAIRIANVRVTGSGAGINVRYAEGVALIACEVESCFGSYKLNTVNDAVVAGCASRKCSQIPLLITGGANIEVQSFSSDNIGAGFADYPHLKVDASAVGVRVNGFRRLNTDQPGTLTWEADVVAAGGRVLAGFHDFTAGKINSGGNFADVSATPIP